MTHEGTVRERLVQGGVMPPMITPLRPDRTVDVASTARLASGLRAAGCAGVLVLGSTGEGPHLDVAAGETVVGTVAGAFDGLVVANAVGSSTVEAALAAARWKQAGADLILAPPPLGFPLSDTELKRHFERVAEAAGEAVLAYNVPARVPTAVPPSVLGDLVRAGVLAGVKDSSGDLDNHRREILAMAGTSGVGLTGSETCVDAAVQIGFVGSIPGLSNVYPRSEIALLEAAKAGRWDEARNRQESIVAAWQLYFAPLGEASFTSVAVGALKQALVCAGVIESATLTEPFLPVTEQIVRHVERHLRSFPVEL